MSGLRVRRSGVFTLLFALAAVLVACGSNDSLQIMGAQPRYNPLTQSTQFADGMASRPPVSDTVSLGDLRDDSLLFTGQSGGQPSASFPFTITREVLLRGQDRFNVFCAPCHSRTGDGNGMIVQRGFPRAASLLSDRLQSAPAGYLFGVISNGFGAMPAYAVQVPAPDRWAIVAYIRALQLSRHATLDDVPSDQRDKLGTDAGP